MKYKSSKIIIIGTIFLTFLFIYVPKATYTNIQTPNLSSTYVPEGLIAMWSGTLDSIPDGWILCDGSQSTPNTTDRFIVNTNGTENSGATGGNSNHSHHYTDVPYHDHGNTGETNCYHSHIYNVPTGGFATVLSGPLTVLSPSLTDTGAADGIHFHATSETGIVSGNTSKSEDLYPPYYKLALIKKNTADPIIPVGIILAWAGSIEEIPHGWNICNGSENTPDLEGKFIMGGTRENPGIFGGNSSHNHTYADIPQHAHSTSNDGASHTHQQPRTELTAMMGAMVMGLQSSPQYTDYADVPHSHTMSGVGQVVCTTEEGNHQPPYHTVAYIMNTQQTEGIPTGCIMAWDGSVGTIPIGWGQCDGNNDTPDLREKFLKCNSLTESIGSTGGSLNHTHAYTEVPSHTHAIQTSNLRHRHSYNGVAGLTMFSLGMTNVAGTSSSSTSTHNEFAPHSHDILPAGIADPETDPESNFPPYIELIFIQQLSPITTIGWLSPAEDATIRFSRVPTVQFDFEYSTTGLGDDVTLYLSNGTDNYDAGSVWDLTNTLIDYLDGDVTATFYLWQGSTELTSATRSFTFTNNDDPMVQLISPNGGETISGNYNIEWTGSDPDADLVHYRIEYNREDTGWTLIGSVEIATHFSWDTTLVPDSDSVKVRVIATDAFNGESIDESDAVFAIDNSGAGNVPGYNIVFLLSLIVVMSLIIARKLKK